MFSCLGSLVPKTVMSSSEGRWYVRWSILTCYTDHKDKSRGFCYCHNGRFVCLFQCFTAEFSLAGYSILTPANSLEKEQKTLLLHSATCFGSYIHFFLQKIVTVILRTNFKILRCFLDNCLAYGSDLHCQKRFFFTAALFIAITLRF